jgi:hypothetical protein
MNLSIGKALRDCPMHKHSYYQIIVYTQGTGTEYVDGKPIRFQPGTIFIIPPGVVHFSTQDGDIFEDIYINGDLGHIFSLNTTAVVLDNSANEGVMLAKMIHANRLANREYVAALTNAFFHFLLENIKLENGRAVFDFESRTSRNASGALQKDLPIWDGEGAPPPDDPPPGY